MKTHKTCLALLVAAVGGAGGCVSVNSPMVQERLKTVSAGYTGCLPEANYQTWFKTTTAAAHGTQPATARSICVLPSLFALSPDPSTVLRRPNEIACVHHEWHLTRA
jgi:hypothetical protein